MSLHYYVFPSKLPNISEIEPINVDVDVDGIVSSGSLTS